MGAPPLIVDLFLSVDGWASGETSPAYYGYPGPDLENWIASELAQPQVALFGRRTYEALAAMPLSPDMANLSKVVFSTTLDTVTWPNTRICRDLIADVSRLKRESDVPLRTMGSLSVARQLVGAGLVDRLRLMTFPLLVGASGREPAFQDVASADLELVSHQVLDGRVLLTEYRPTGHDIPQTS
jgi:dihydrofolate reductase